MTEAPPPAPGTSLLRDGMRLSRRLKLHRDGGSNGAGQLPQHAALYSNDTRAGEELENATSGTEVVRRFVYGVFTEMCRDTQCVNERIRSVLMGIQMLQVWMRGLLGAASSPSLQSRCLGLEPEFAACGGSRALAICVLLLELCLVMPVLDSTATSRSLLSRRGCRVLRRFKFWQLLPLANTRCCLCTPLPHHPDVFATILCLHDHCFRAHRSVVCLPALSVAPTVTFSRFLPPSVPPPPPRSSPLPRRPGALLPYGCH